MMRANILLDLIDQNPWQTRQVSADRAASLADDIRQNGLLQPPVGRVVNLASQAVPAGWLDLQQIQDADRLVEVLAATGFRIQIAFGHHRLAAFRLLETQVPPRFTLMPVDIQPLSDEQMALYGWSENEHRGDLNTYEKAQAIQRYITDFGWTQEQAAQKVGLARSTVANLVRMLTRLPGEALEALRQGTISERQAMALLPLVDIPADAVAYAEKKEYNYSKPSHVLEVAVKGGNSSDDIRRMVERAIEEAAIQMNDLKFADYPFEGEGFVSAICTGCKKQVKSSNGFPLCQSPDCYNRKRETWRAEHAQSAMMRTGLSLADPDLHYNDYKDFYGEEQALILKQLNEHPCEHMRLKEMNYGAIPEGVEGFGVICQHGKGKHCTCLAAALKKFKAEDPKELAKKQAIKDVTAAKAEARDLLVQALADNVPGAWLALWVCYASYGEEKNFTVETPVEKIQAALVQHMIEYTLTNWAKDDAEKAREQLGRLLDGCDLRASWMPEKATPAEAAWAQYQRIRGWMDDLAREFPTAEMVRGNIANLGKLIVIPGLEQVQWEAISAACDLLEELLPLVEGWTADDRFSRVTTLAGYPDTDLQIIEATLQQASQAEAQYLLLLPDLSSAKRDACIRRLLQLALS